MMILLNNQYTPKQMNHTNDCILLQVKKSRSLTVIIIVLIIAC